MQYKHFFRIVRLLILTRTKWREALIGYEGTKLNHYTNQLSFTILLGMDYYWFLCPLYLQMLSHWEKRDTMLSAIDRNTVHQVHTLKTVWRVVCKVAIARVRSMWIKKGRTFGTNWASSIKGQCSFKLQHHAQCFEILKKYMRFFVNFWPL